MAEFTDETPMPFGKHKDTKLEKVPADYLLWLADQPGFAERNPELSAYVEKNRALLDDEQQDERRGFDGRDED
jgi:hypothetical protein